MTMGCVPAVNEPNIIPNEDKAALAVFIEL
jgi:hypothetical protein